MKSEILGHRPPLRMLLALVLLAGGCGGDYDGPAIHPVSGKVLVDGKPAAKALITFHALSGTLGKASPFAEADDDGSFRPSTHLTGDGAPAGEYTLTIVWPEIKIDQGEEISGPDRLGGQYCDSKGSKLKVTIKEGENVLSPFELKSPAQSPPRTTGPGDRGR